MIILNNMKTTTQINQKSRERERERERMLSCAASNYLIEFEFVIPWQNDRTG